GRSPTCAHPERILHRDDLSHGLTYELDRGLPAPVLAIRYLLQLRPNEVCPAVRLRFGTTRGTNALLTRTGARTALITTTGFADVPLIGNQDRPKLFDLNIVKPESLFCRVVEVSERVAANGRILHPLLPDASARERLKQQLRTQLADVDSAAICLMNAFRNPTHEIELESLLMEIGGTEISRSSEVAPLIRFVPRCDTTVLDAYLNPILRRYLDRIRELLPGSNVQVMTSAGGLVDAASFRGRDCILSGPAGGIVGFSAAAADAGFSRAIGFDMGGTSTDVARFDGRFEYQTETVKAGVRIMTPVLAIETVAAGGGSICGFDGVRLFVGPQSAGADPGPACYGAGGPLTVTDLNVFLGRIIPDRFPFPLDRTAVQNRLTELRQQMLQAGAVDADYSLQTLAEGLLRIADDNMTQAIRRVSVAKGYNPADYVLVCFGGAGGQHACSIARRLGMRRVLIHPSAGILSAYGMGQADVRILKQTSVLRPLEDLHTTELQQQRSALEDAACRDVTEQHPGGHIRLRFALQLRYSGTDSALTIDEPSPKSWPKSSPKSARSAIATEHDFLREFETAHRRLFGYVRPGRAVEISAMLVEAVSATVHQSANQEMRSEPSEGNPVIELPGDGLPPLPGRRTVAVHSGGIDQPAMVAERSDCLPGHHITGPAVICEATSTTFVAPGWTAAVTPTGSLMLETAGDGSAGKSPPAESAISDKSADLDASADPILLELFSNQFASIAEQMGETLRRTSISTNVRERLDFSCALFDRHGQLVVNAPHVPVHLGAMGETVRAVIADHPDMRPGDVFVTNDPYRGGSHLPDVTVVTPVFSQPTGPSPSPDFFVANRAHHAEIGGIAPGSMPPFSRTLAEEGVLIRSRRLVQLRNDQPVFDEDGMRELLSTAAYPSRAVADNLADLTAQVAANEAGVRLLAELTARQSVAMVQSYMKHLQAAASGKMRQCLSRLPNGQRTFADALDDGTPVCVTVQITDDQAVLDFTGSGDVHPGNLNANRAIVTAAVLYSLRCLLNEDIPLNAGVLEPVTLIIPSGILNPPAGSSPQNSPAVVGGNVETSQRLVDVILGAFDLAAASQGTMNNLTFGDGTFGYYETICGGAGATSAADGANAVHTHMTNTRLTDPEVLEQRFPVRLRRFCIRSDSGGAGDHRGGNGILRELEFLKPLHVSMLTQRRTRQPFGLHGGTPGAAGQQQHYVSETQTTHDLPGCFSTEFRTGDRLIIQTPGGGGWGEV
ncbi:MAG: hydantoinase B/oxoprolinase family protein, partial [Planctomycetaceae bacterium]|nr:hydantoinase B/oxoprolinase family protein [Planctomycetaceae bacterium]